jgi:hypothetical protein
VDSVLDRLALGDLEKSSRGPSPPGLATLAAASSTPASREPSAAAQNLANRSGSAQSNVMLWTVNAMCCSRSRALAMASLRRLAAVGARDRC